MDKKQLDFLHKDCADAALGSLKMLDELKNQKVLVAGGTGFIGSWIAEFVAYLNDNHQFNTSLVILSRNSPMVLPIMFPTKTSTYLLQVRAHRAINSM